MLDTQMQGQLQSYLEKIAEPIELVAALGEDAKSRELEELLNEIAALSDKVSVRRDAGASRAPSFGIAPAGGEARIRFAGIPLGHEFSSLVLALLQVGGHAPKISDELAERIRGLEGQFCFETYMSLSCQNCPTTVQSLNILSVLNPGITHEAIDGSVYRDEVERREIMSVPTVMLGDEEFDQGRMTVEEIVQRLDVHSAERDAELIRSKEPFDTLVVGGGPAGASAAIYAARKGIRTGVAAERFGGQVADTLGIENFISVNYTEGPKLTAALEQHVTDYEVDVMNMQRATRLVPASESASGLVEVEMDNGASLTSRTVVLSTGARWRQLGVPGEEEYRNKGVAYCPHCDGPLYKGKHVAVIGGGNSGVEAAIDLAGIVRHVTVVEYADKLGADDVLQRKLRSMDNVDVIVGAQTTEITGDGQKVNGLRYLDRASEQSHDVELEGVFVQIGLLPNTEWLQGSLELSQHGEIVVDERGATSLPGVFAAGDATTVPYKQIVIAMGSGSTAALSAFDYLIRHSAPAEEQTHAA